MKFEKIWMNFWHLRKVLLQFLKFEKIKWIFEIWEKFWNLRKVLLQFLYFLDQIIFNFIFFGFLSNFELALILICLNQGVGVGKDDRLFDFYRFN